MASSSTLVKNTQDSVAEREAKESRSPTENGQKFEVKEVPSFSKPRSSRPSLRLSIFRKKGVSGAQKTAADEASGTRKATVEKFSGVQETVVENSPEKTSARRTSSLGVDGSRSSSPLQKKVTPTLSSGGLPLKGRFCCSFRNPKQFKKNLIKNNSSLSVIPPSVVLTPEYGLESESSRELSKNKKVEDPSKNKKLQESLVMSKKSSFEEQLLSAVQPSSLPNRYLMNDWEIGGTQNPWVCPSDRHLQLRAQLKSGWSVRTASARSPTNIKQAAGAISDAEQEQIRKVLARAEAGKMNEQQRIGKMVDRLEKMRGRATGNGVTQCLLCQTDFGLLASKSYAAMCMDCRKYVCQKNCGVETYDQKRGEPVFLCKICSEYREVMWKKSGAWFYKEMPTYVKPTVNGNTPGPGTSQRSFWQHHTGSASNLQNLSSAALSTLSLHESGPNQFNSQNPGNYGSGNPPSPRVSRQLPIPPDQQQRLKTIPRPRITPSWVHDKVQSSMSLGSEEEESSSSSVEQPEFKKQNAPSLSASGSSRRHHHFHRPKDLNRFEGPGSSASSSRHTVANAQKFAVGNRNQVTDTDDSENDESRRTTPSTSPRHSLATPSSYGGDDLSQNQASLAANEASDARSIDSGVVQSDHSVQQPQLHQSSSNNLSMNPKAGISPPPQTEPAPFKLSTEILPKGKTPPPQNVERSTSSASSSTASSSALFHNIFPTMPHRDPPVPPQGHRASQQSQESSSALSARITESSRRSESTHSNEFNQINSGEVENSLTVENKDNVIKMEESASPTFMSSPEDDTNALQGSKKSNPKTFGTKAFSVTSANGVISRGFSKSSIGQNSVDFLQESEKSAKKQEIGPDSVNSVISLSPSVVNGDVHTCDVDSDSYVDIDDDSSSDQDINSDYDNHIDHHINVDNRTLGSIQFNLTYLHEDKQLIIHLIRAKNLKAMDKNGFSDPYVKFHIIPGNAKATKLTSKTIEKTLNPEWHEELIYYGITEEDRIKKTLRITIEKTEEVERGKILISICYNIQQGSLFVHIKRCAELLGMDSTGFSDPYCKVSLTPLNNKSHRLKTSIKKRTLNPEFNETLQFIVPFKDLPKKTLEIGVYDHDVGKHDDYIGKLSYYCQKRGIVLSTAAKSERGQQWTSCIENPGKTFESWHKLDPNT
ncbi:hypothetical protein FO519_002310 [Halicephalobus sp. NKZ332]|nr:hypothetical protein FO519_002310 [Halicephalobus sp. NKZ332]